MKDASELQQKLEALKKEIYAFDKQCAEDKYTDTEEAWRLLYKVLNL